MKSTFCLVAVMPQLQLPIFRDGVTQITSELGYAKEDGLLVFYNGSLPIFSHEESDLGSFKMILSQLYINGSASQTELADAFGIQKQALKRWVKKYRIEGIQAFFIERRGRPRVKKKI
ncbi:MAG: helix-turn-helix domain containing protein [Verrucomicrobiales bacterium]|nr:helix-turn-helix domain containing protein [Verrucomicrobiales bacterium]